MNVGDLWMILNGFCEFSKFDEKGLLVEKTRWSGRHECHMSLQALLFAHSVSSHVCSGRASQVGRRNRSFAKAWSITDSYS